MSRLTLDGTVEPVSRDQILRRELGQGKHYFPCSADHKQDWQPYSVDPYSTICDDYTCVCVCVCVCVIISFILDVWLVDVPAGVTQEEGHTEFLIHLPFSREKDSAVPFPRRP